MAVRPSPFAPEPEKVQKLFNEIAQGYDCFNTFASLSLDRRWRKCLIEAIGENSPSPGVVLDLGTGTGDLIFDILKANRLKTRPLTLGIDFSYPMLKKAREKLNYPKSLLVQGNIEFIPLQSESVGIVMNAFVMRNVKKIMQSVLFEIYRVTAPGGKAFFLDMYVPSLALMSFFHRIYLKTFLPMVGHMVFGKNWSGGYLSQTIFNFGLPQEFSELLAKAGFRQVKFKPFYGGMAVLHTAVK